MIRLTLLLEVAKCTLGAILRAGLNFCFHSPKRKRYAV
jgi:hypothetical protein